MPWAVVAGVDGDYAFDFAAEYGIAVAAERGELAALPGRILYFDAAHAGRASLQERCLGLEDLNCIAKACRMNFHLKPFYLGASLLGVECLSNSRLFLCLIFGQGYPQMVGLFEGACCGSSPQLRSALDYYHHRMEAILLHQPQKA